MPTAAGRCRFFEGGHAVGVKAIERAIASLPYQSELQELGALQGGKIVIRNERQHDFASWRLVNREAFHVVDFKAQVRLEDDRTIDDRTGFDVSDLDAPNLHQQSFGPT